MARSVPTQPDQVPGYSKLRFGLADAEQEGVREPELLLEGFHDVHCVIEKLLEGHEYLVLGYKGSGKSAIAQHLRLQARSDDSLFVRTAFLADFPYADFRSMVPGPSDADARMPAGWTWILLCQMLDSFREDQGSESVQEDRDFQTLLSRMAQAGWLPGLGVPVLVRETVRKSLKTSLAKILEYTSDRSTPAETSEPDPGLLLDVLTKRAAEFRSSSEHILIIDGLDDILIGSSPQYKALAALLISTQRLNNTFRLEGTPAKVVLLCRTDLFERLPGTNKNKLRQDSAVHLDWYHHTRQPEESDLVQLLNRKASVGLKSPVDVLSNYFPTRVNKRPIYKFMLDLTRHTPRDFLQLCRRMQEFAPARGRLAPTQVLSGARWYSTDYFFGEIKDEVVGYLNPTDAEAVFDLLAGMKARQFTLTDAQAYIHENGRPTLDLARVFSVLFECSAVGNIDRQETSAPYFTFRYRNRHSRFSLSEQITVHPGLWDALYLRNDYVKFPRQG